MGRTFDWCYETRLEPDPISPARARSFVVHHLVEHRLLYLVDPVRLVASELATNAVLHAQTPFTVSLSQRNHLVTVSVEDAEPERLPTIVRQRVVSDHGHGLRIVDLMSQGWGVSADPHGAKLVWASFATRRSPTAEGPRYAASRGGERQP